MTDWSRNPNLSLEMLYSWTAVLRGYIVSRSRRRIAARRAAGRSGMLEVELGVHLDDGLDDGRSVVRGICALVEHHDAERRGVGSQNAIRIFLISYLYLK